MAKTTTNNPQHHHHHHNPPTRRSELISAQALQHVVRPLQKKRPLPLPQEREDPVGDQMTRLLNANPDFSYDPSRPTTSTTTIPEEEGFSIFPLFCHRNWVVVKRTYRRLYNVHPITMVLNLVGFCYEKAPNRHTLDRTLLLLVAWIAMGCATVIVTSHICLQWVGRAACLVVLQLLLDWKDLKKHMPPRLKWVGQLVLQATDWMDKTLFLRKRYAGREWNETEFELEDHDAKSRHEALWSLPPPCIRDAGPQSQLCLDPRYMAREEWSPSTSKHVVAINFCYLMMKEDHARKQRGRRSNTTKEEEQTIVDSSSPQEEELHVLPNNNNPHTEKVVLGMSVASTSSPSGGIEVVRENSNPDIFKRQESSTRTLRLSSFAESSSNNNSNNNLATPKSVSGVLSDDRSVNSSVASCSSAVAADMNWVDISARIGMRVLNSAHLQRVVASEEAAERLKNITDQFGSVVGSPDQAQANTSITSPYEVRSLKELLQKSANRVPHGSLSRSPCRPVHSMWTSAAAAATAGSSSDEESTIASLELGWKESASFEQLGADSAAGDHHAPSAPPRIIRTRHFPSTSSPRKASHASPGRELENAKHPRVMDLIEMEDAASQQESMFLEEQSHEMIIDYRCPDSTTRSYSKRGRSYSQSHTGSLYTDRKMHERMPLAAGIKVAAPFFPVQPGGRRRVGHSNYQMATVVSSKRLYVDNGTGIAIGPANCLSVTCKVDKSFLRNGEFAELTFRVMDEWGSRYMPKHSKVPIGACVATTFGIGIVVGWRVEDDMHVIRSLWQRRGAGAAHAYLNRDAIHEVLEAAVGFEVLTKCGSGKVLGYVDAGRTYQNGRYVVTLQDDGVYKNCVVTLHRKDIHACHGAQFIPVIEHIKEACDYQIMLDTYRALVRQQTFNDEDHKGADDQLWKFWSENADILWQSFLKAVDEDNEFDEGVNRFMGSVIDFLERLDHVPSSKHSSENADDKGTRADGDDASTGEHSNMEKSPSDGTEDREHDAGFWILNDMLGGIFPAPGGKERRKEADAASDSGSTQADTDVQSEVLEVTCDQTGNSISYKRAFAVVRTLMKTVSLARAANPGNPQFRLAMTVCQEFLMFARTVIKVQQKNVSPQSLEVWRSAVQEIISTFGPLKERLMKIGRGVAQRMESQGRRAKIRVLRFADSILVDELFLNALCQGEWKRCLVRIETSLVKANIIDEASCGHYRKTARFIYEHLLLLSSNESGAAERNNEKLKKFAKFVQLMASPKRSFLKLIRNDEVSEILERILVRVFYREEVASRMLTIHATNFKSLRHLRILKDLSVSGRMWIPLLDAADEEFSYVVSRMPENAKELMCPLSSIFSLCVAQFHKISAGHSTKDWLDFLLEEDGVRIIHELDMKLILALSSFSRDVKDMMLIIPYYPSIDDDILKLMDEVELDKLLKEASEAIDDADKLAGFIREKAATAIERFLAYLPKLSIPVERRELGEGWVLTVGQEGGGDLTLSDVKVKRENLVCEVMGGDALFLPIFGEDDADRSVAPSAAGSMATGDSGVSGAGDRIEESILDDIREMILQAQRHGNWTVGIGGVGQPPSDPYVASVLQNLPITSVLGCAIDLWRNLEIDDDELLEIAIRDVSYQIQLHAELEEKSKERDPDGSLQNLESPSGGRSSLSGSASFEEATKRFNPRVDPTVLLLEMKNVTLHLERFRFRIEKSEKRTIFDPVFEGCGTVSVQNLNILLRVEVARERIGKVGSYSVAPVLLLRELEVEIEHVRLKVEDTGADWLLNQAVKGFSENITDVVESNLKEQIQEQTKQTLEQLNSYFLVNQDILLNILGISLDDLEEHIVWV